MIDFGEFYKRAERLCRGDNGRPAVDPLARVKMALLQHRYGIKSLRQTVREADMSIACRWFIGCGCDTDTPVPHFATIRSAFASRFPGEALEEIVAWILEAAVAKGHIKAERIFLDATHIKVGTKHIGGHRIGAAEDFRHSPAG